LKQQLFKILILAVLASYLSSCDAVKRVSENEYLLTDNKVIVNGKKESSETINNLLYQNPNRKILGVPLRLHIYNSARPNIDSTLQAQIYDNEEKVARKTKLLSRKQLDKDVETRKGFNSWLKKTGEAPVIVSAKKTGKSIKRFRDYYFNNGWFDVDATFYINKDENKRANIDYYITTGKGFLIDSISKKITSPLVELLYEASEKKSLIKVGEQYRTQNF
jgi:hypothetical protein